MALRANSSRSLRSQKSARRSGRSAALARRLRRRLRAAGLARSRTIATNASFKKNGEWQDRTIWNEVSVFEETSRAYVTKSFGKGDMVRAVGTIRQNSYEKDGERRYTTDLVIEEISRAPQKKTDAPAEEPAAETEPERQVAGSKAKGRKAA